MKALLLFVFCSLLSANAFAEAPNLLTYQGRLKEGGQAVSGNRAVEILLCDAETFGNCYTSGAQSLTVSNGLFRSTFTVPVAANFGAGDWYLEIWVAGTQLTPRERLTSGAYSLFSATAAYATNIAAATGSDGVYISSNLYVNGGGKYYGDGSQLTGITASLVAANGVQAGPLNTDVIASSIAVNSVYDSAMVSPKVNRFGDTMTGYLAINGATFQVLGDPTVPFSLAAGTGTLASHLYVSSNGYVGMGTTVPEQRLTVAGNISQTGVLISSGAGSNYFAGSVGIGTAAPTQALDVTGNIWASASMGVGESPNAGDIHIRKVVPGGAVRLYVENASNLPGADANALIQVGGSGANDPMLHLSVSGVSDWTVGIDNSDADKFKISEAAGVLGANDRFTLQAGGNIGVSTGAPQARLDVLAGGAAQTDMAQIWRDSGGVVVGSMSATGVLMATKIVGPIAGGDDLGNHIATQVLQMGANQVAGTGAVTMSSYTATGIGISAAQLRLDAANNIAISSEANAALGGGLRVSTNVYIVGFSSAARYYGDGSGLTGVIASDATKLPLAGGTLSSGLTISGSTLAVRGPGDIMYLNSADDWGAIYIAEGVAQRAQLGYARGTTIFSNGEIPTAGFMNGNSALQLGANSLMALTLSSTGRTGVGFNNPLYALDISTVNLTDAYLFRSGVDGIVISTGGAIQTTGLGYGTTTGAARGQGAVDLQTSRSAAGQVASGLYSVVAGGQGNSATASWATVSGGNANTASGQYSMVGGGVNNTASGNFSFAGGWAAQSTQQGAFTWADSANGTPLINDVSDRTVFRSGGGFLVTGSTSTSPSGTVNRGVFITGNGLIGISTGTPGAALDVVSTGTAANAYAQIWRNSSGVVTASVTSLGAFSGDGSGLINVSANDAAKLPLNGGTMTGQLTMQSSTLTIINPAVVPDFRLSRAGTFNWDIGGNAGTFLNFVYNATPMVVFDTLGRVGIGTNSPGARLEVTGGSVTVHGIVSDANVFQAGDNGILISTGGAVRTTGSGHGTVAGNARGSGAVDLQTSRTNASQAASGAYSVISGGKDNTAGNYACVVGGGQGNSCTGNSYGTVSGGMGNSAENTYATVGGGSTNRAIAFFSAVAGGQENVASGDVSSVGGGGYNVVSGSNSVVPGGFNNIVIGTSAVVAGGEKNKASGMFSAVSGGFNNTASGISAAVAGGSGNTASADYSAVSGGRTNTATQYAASVSGGWLNNATNNYAAIGGGISNAASGFAGAIAGGRENIASGESSFVGGGGMDGLGNGGSNKAQAKWSAVAGGSHNEILSDGTGAFIGGGMNNISTGAFSTVGGGRMNTSSGAYSSVTGGYFNVAQGLASFIGGGGNNTTGLTAWGAAAFGASNASMGSYSFAAGYKSTAAVAGAFSWADSSGEGVVNSVQDQVMFKAKGGFWVSTGTIYANPALFVDSNNNIGIGTTTPVASLDVIGTAKLSRYLVAAMDAGGALTADDFGKTITINSPSPQTLTLPTATAGALGAQVTFVKLNTGKVTITAAGTDYIADSTVGGSIYNNAVSPAYATITLRLVTANQWMLVGGEGSWITN